VELRADTIRQWHVQQGYEDIGYHLVIQPSGEVERGRALNKIGAHVKGHNTSNIGVCLIGTDRFSMEQFDALARQFDAISMTYQIDIGDVYCHYEFDTAKKQGKACPNIRAADLVLWLLTRDVKLIDKYLRR
jgi:hypothetical protein